VATKSLSPDISGYHRGTAEDAILVGGDAVCLSECISDDAKEGAEQINYTFTGFQDLID
jgi:hypothetical protein